MAARVSATPVNTFTVVFPGHGRYDEASYARLVSEHFGTNHHQLEMEHAGPEVLAELAYQFDDPIADHALVPTFLLSKKIHEVAKVALGGDGGDELFGGYPHHGWATRHRQLRGMIPSALRAGAASVAEALPPGTTGRNHGIGLRGDIANALAHFNLYFDRGFRAKLLGWHLETDCAEARKARSLENTLGPVEQAFRSDFRTTLPEGYLAKVDRASMLASLEMRAPFLDDRISDFAWRRIPANMKVDGKARKQVPVRLAEHLLPQAMEKQRKQGFTMPLGNWMQGRWGGYMKDILLDPGQTLFDQKQIRRLFKLQRRGYNNQNRLFALTMLTLWQHGHGVTD
jgi:asparagine synthase (glutamine-hydrolysing)